MIRTVLKDSYVKRDRGSNHHAISRLSTSWCYSCRIGRHDCKSLHCQCSQCGQVIKED